MFNVCCVFVGLTNVWCVECGKNFVVWQMLVLVVLESLLLERCKDRLKVEDEWRAREWLMKRLKNCDNWMANKRGEQKRDVSVMKTKFVSYMTLLSSERHFRLLPRHLSFLNFCYLCHALSKVKSPSSSHQVIKSSKLQSSNITTSCTRLGSPQILPCLFV